MSICELNIHHLRNISSARLSFHPHCNVFQGFNGSGKTSLLEALYLLSTGHSFRTREISPLVSHGALALTVFARTSSGESISIQKSLTGPTQVKLNSQVCHSSSELAFFLPAQVFYQDIFQIIDAGPSVRRSLLDWGLFHVEQSYHKVWKDYRLVLKHRNALLRQKASLNHFSPWDRQLVELANELDRMRASYFNELSGKFQQILSKLTDEPCTIGYYKGWDRIGCNKSLETILSDQLLQDIQRQYTYSGAHQADINFDLSSNKAKLLLSRGQQKIVLMALRLAQASLVSKDCLYLFDDISAELDSYHLDRLFNFIGETRGQFFITAINDVSLDKLSASFDLKFYTLNKGEFMERDLK